MGYGSGNDYKSLLYFNLSAKQGEPIKWKIKKYNDGVSEELPSEEKVWGKLIGVAIKEKEWNDEKYKVLILRLADKDELYILSIPFSYLGRGIMNSLLSITKQGNLSIKVYTKNDFGCAHVKYDEEKLPWKHNMKELNEMILTVKGKDGEPIKVGGKDLKDYDKINQFLIHNLETLFNTIEFDTVPEKSGDNFSEDNVPDVKDKPPEIQDEDMPPEFQDEKEPVPGADDLPF